jgi:type II secretory pathway pseudopilin PulG
VAIIGILTTIAVGSFNSFSRAQTVKIAASDLKSDIRLVKTNASAGKKAELCRQDSLKDDGSSGSDLRDDRTLIGHFLTFEVNSGTYTSGQRCQASTPDIAAAIVGAGGSDPVVEEESKRKLSQNTFIEEIRLYDSPTNNCETYSTAADKITVEFFTVNAGDDPGAANSKFYLNGVADGANPDPLPLCASVHHLTLTLASPSTTGTYEVTIESSGNIYEKKI